MTATSSNPHCAGEYAASFAPVASEFARAFDGGEETGAAVCVYQHGEKVVDVWAGTADVESGRPWAEDTAAVVMSTTKGFTAACVLLAAERDLIDLDAPIASYWPEFGVEGKEQITVRYVLTHRAGIPVIDKPLGYQDLVRWQPVIDAIAAQRPAWEPGMRHGYHPTSTGWVLSEALRQVTGRTARHYLADEIAVPLGLSLSIGLEAGEQRDVAPLVAPPSSTADPEHPLARALTDPTSLAARSLSNPVVAPHDFNSREALELEIPSGNGITTARSLARLYGAMVGEIDGIRLLQPATVAAARTREASGTDEVLHVRSDFGLGFMLPGGPMFPSWGADAFGHGGAGGSLGFGDPDTGIAFGYVMNRMAPGLGAAARAHALAQATYECIAS